MFSLVFLCKGSFSLTALTRRRSCAGLRLSKNFSPPSHLSSSPLPFRKRVQKYYLFPNWQALFSFIFQVSHITLIVREKFFQSMVQAGKTCTLLYITMTHQWGKETNNYTLSPPSFSPFGNDQDRRYRGCRRWRFRRPSSADGRSTGRIRR